MMEQESSAAVSPGPGISSGTVAVNGPVGRREAVFSVTAVPAAIEVTEAPSSVLDIEEAVALLFDPIPDTWSLRWYRATKRTVDVAVSLLGLAVLWPAFLVIALAIRLDSPGPAFFIQERAGYLGRSFRMIKFRTMVDGSRVLVDAPVHKFQHDPRVTRVGRILRSTSLDEIPQLINVLLGHMSIVGPRPEIPAIVRAHYQPWQYERFLVPQGITGWWQVNGRGGKLMYEHTEDDIYYVEHAGLGLDGIRERLKTEIEALRGEIAALMQAAVQAGSEALAESTEQVVVSGERNLLEVQDFGSDLGSLRKLFDLFERKTELMRLLDVSSRAEGVRIYIGGESGVVPFEELSVVSAPYVVDGEVVGTLGVIGPTRMPYERMIQIVDITSRLVSHALSHHRH